MEKYLYFNEHKFTRDERTGYYLSAKPIDGKRIRMHRYIYEFHNGKLPDGYHVHHLDRDKNNNNIDNLKAVSSKGHADEHAEDRAARYDKIVENLRVNVRPKASEWHGSKEGRAWHKKQYERTKKSFNAIKEFKCEYCDKKFTTKMNGANRFCSNNCKSNHRRKSGVDNEERTCICCGKTFTTNKYTKQQCCSGSCSAKERWRRKNSKD